MSHRDLFFHESILEMLAALSKVLREQKVDFFLIGAIARDIRLSASAEYKPRRMTKDVDIAIWVGSEQEFQKVKQALIATGDFTAHDKWAIRLFYKHAIDLDLLPFGDIEGADREVRIEKPQLFLIDMPGFAEVMPEAEVLKVGNTELRICSLEGLVLLKLFANANNSTRTKDISDIEDILQLYFDLETEKIFTVYPDVPDQYSTADADYMALVSARITGRVMGKLLKESPDLQDRLLNILNSKTPNRYWPEMATGLAEAAGKGQ
jgi:predicted nucleotidyltransferase